jgi:hypothetical protein
VDGQFGEFVKFQEQEGSSYKTVGAMLDGFLKVEVPNDDTALVTWYDAGDGRGPSPQSVSAHGYTGEDKAAMFVRLRRGDPAIPAGRVRQDRALVLADCAAAPDLDAARQVDA